jgi:hypothetical protein
VIWAPAFVGAETVAKLKRNKAAINSERNRLTEIAFIDSPHAKILQAKWAWVTFLKSAAGRFFNHKLARCSRANRLPILAKDDKTHQSSVCGITVVVKFMAGFANLLGVGLF